MKYYHCPTTYYRRSYGCGFGPINMSQAVFDYSLQCPHCGRQLRPCRSAGRKRMAAVQECLDAAAAVEQLFGKGQGVKYLAGHSPRM